MDQKLKSLLINNLSSEWKKFAHDTGMSSIKIEYIDIIEESDQDKMEHFLTRLIKRNAYSYLTLLEKSLKNYENTYAVCYDLFPMLCQIKCLFAKERLKLHYNTIYGSSYNSTNQHSPKDLIVFTNHYDLIKLDDGLENNKVNDTEWEDFAKKKYCYKTIDFDNVFAQEQPLLLISGVAGIGKTYFLRNCLLLWAHGLLWNNVDFVFYLKFESISKFQNISCLDALINKFYGNILKGFKIPSQCSVTLVIDGFDRFTHFDKLHFHKLGDFSDIPLLNTLENIFSSRETKCVIAGRVQTITTYWRACINSSVTNIQLMGLNSLGIRCYLEDNLLHTILKNQLNEILSSSFEGKQILSVPLYLKAVCSILSSSMISSVKTNTELMTLIFYYFLKRKWKSHDQSRDQLPQLIHSKRHYILEVCKLAFILFEKEIKFLYKDELDPILDFQSLDSDGIIEMFNFNLQYGFTHYIIMKYCASTYLYLYESPQIALTNKRLHNCLPIVSGLCYGGEKNILSLMCNLRNPVYKEKNWLQEIFDFNKKKLFIESLFESQTFLKDDLKMSMVVLNAWYDNRSETDVMAEKYFLNKTEKLYRLLEFQDIKFQVTQIMTQINENNQEAIEGMCVNKQFDDSGNSSKEEEHIKSEILEENYEDALTNKLGIGRLLYDEKCFVEAENIFREAEIIQNKVLGEKHIDTINTKYYIGMCLYAKLEYDDAERLFSQVHNLRNKTLGKKHVDTITTKYFIGMCLYNKKAYDNANKLLTKVQNKQKEILGKNHFDTITTKLYVGMCLYYKKCYDKAEKVFRKVHNMRYENLGKNHFDKITLKYFIGMCLYNKKAYIDAKSLFQEVHKLQKEILGENHFDTITTQFYIGMCFYYIEIYDEAEKLLKEVYNIRNEILGEEHVDTITAKYNFGMCLYLNKKYSNAEQILREVYSMQVKILGENHKDTLATKKLCFCCFIKST